MLLTKFDPFKELANFQRVFNNMPLSVESDTGISAFVPKVNTREDDKAYYIDLDLPGIKKDDINIDVNDGTLTIYGERSFKKEVKEEDYYKVESSFGKFQRAFTLPESVNIDDISAKNEDGVLEVVIPKLAKNTNKKKIKIK